MTRYTKLPETLPESGIMSPVISAPQGEAIVSMIEFWGDLYVATGKAVYIIESDTNDNNQP